MFKQEIKTEKWIQFLKAAGQPVSVILLFSLFFSALRLYEIIMYRPLTLLSGAWDVFSILIFSFISDSGFFLFYNAVYIVFYVWAETLKKDLHFKMRKVLFLTLNTPLVILFFIDMQSLAVSGDLFRLPLLSAFDWGLVYHSLSLLKDYRPLIFGMTGFVFIFVYFFPLKYHLVLPRLRARVLFYSMVAILSLSYMGIIYLPRMFSVYQAELRYNGLAARFIHSYYPKMCQTRFFTQKKLKQMTMIRQMASIHDQKKGRGQNVIVFVIESLNQNHIHSQTTPFLNSLLSKSAYFKNNLSLTRSTSQNVSSILTSLPDFLPERRRPKNTFLSILKKQGYSLLFFFGGKKTTFNFDKTTKELGIDFYYSKEDFLSETKKEEEIDGAGDVWDKPFLLYKLKKLKNQKQPFFSVVLTNQPHYPWKCPQKGAAARSSKADNPQDKREKYFHCLKYIDETLKVFFEKIKKETNLFQNTLFVITGDHVNPSTIDHSQINYSTLHNVPLLFYHPEEDLSIYSNNEVSSHLDILPSIAHFLKLERPAGASLVHHSVFDKTQKRKVLNYNSNPPSYFFIDGEKILRYSCHNSEFEFFHKSHFHLGGGRTFVSSSLNQKERVENQMKAYIQHLWHGVPIY